MKKTNAVKGFLLGALGFMALGFGACNSSSETDEFTGFLPGAQTVMTTGDSIFIEEIVDKVKSGAYTITISGNGKVEDVTDKVGWRAITTGTYVITYTVESGANKGTYTHTINVVSLPHIAVSHEETPIAFLYEQEMRFADFFEAQNITVTSHNSKMWTPIMVSVRVDGQIIEFDETQTSYKLQSLSDHYFTYKIRTTDGRERKLIGTVQVKYSFDETDLWLDANANGQYAIEVANVASVKMNDKVCAATDVEITDTSIVFTEQVLRDNYSGVNNVSVFMQSGEEKRYVLNVYTDAFDMENGLPDGIFLFKDFTNNNAMKLTEFNGSKAMCLWGDYKWQRFYITKAYMDFVFSNPEIDVFEFDITLDFTATTGVTYVWLQNDASGKGTQCEKGQTMRMRVSRAEYEQYGHELGTSFTFQNQVNNTGTVKLTWYIDNMQARTLRFDGTFETMTAPDVASVFTLAYAQTAKFEMGLVEDPLGENGKVFKMERKEGHQSAPLVDLNMTRDMIKKVVAGNILSMKVYSVNGSNLWIKTGLKTNLWGHEIVSNDGWTTIEVALTDALVAAIQENNNTIRFEMNGDPHTYYFDDIKISEPPAYDSTFESWTAAGVAGLFTITYAQTAKFEMGLVEDPLGENGKVFKLERKEGHQSAPLIDFNIPKDLLEKVVAGNTLSMNVYSVNGSNLWIKTGLTTNLWNYAIVSNDGWTTIEVDLTEELVAAIKENNNTIRFEMNGNPHTYYLDDIKIYEPLAYDGTFESWTEATAKKVFKTYYGSVVTALVADPLGENGKVFKMQRETSGGSAPLVDFYIPADLLEKVVVGNTLSMKVYSVNAGNGLWIKTNKFYAADGKHVNLWNDAVVANDGWTTIEVVLTEDLVAKLQETKTIHFEFNSVGTYYFDSIQISEPAEA